MVEVSTAVSSITNAIAGPCGRKVAGALLLRRQQRRLIWMVAFALGGICLLSAVETATSHLQMVDVASRYPWALCGALVAAIVAGITPINRSLWTGARDQSAKDANAELSISERIAWQAHIRNAEGIPAFARNDLMNSWPTTPLEIAERIERYQLAMEYVQRVVRSERAR